MEGCVEDKNHKGRPRLEYKQQIMRDRGRNSYVEAKRKTSNREEGRMATNQSQD